MLLNELRNSDLGKAVNWSLIGLLPYGGIRIEDNIAVLDGKPVNLTRQAFEPISERHSSNARTCSNHRRL